MCNLLFFFSLLLSLSNRKECLALCLLLSLIKLSLLCVVVSGSRELLLSLGLRCRGCLGSIVRLYITVDDLGCILGVATLVGFLSLDSSGSLLAVNKCKCLTLSALISFSAPSCLIKSRVSIVCVIGELYCLVIIDCVSLYICICGSNNANRRLLLVTVLGNEQYYLLICTGKGSSVIIIILRLECIINSLDHGCSFLILVAICSSLILLSLSFSLVSGKKLSRFLNAGITPLGLKLFLELLSSLDSKDIVASESSKSCSLGSISLKKLLCLVDTGIYELFLLNLCGLLGNLLLKSRECIGFHHSLLHRSLSVSISLSLLLGCMLSKERVALCLIVLILTRRSLFFAFFYKRA